MYSPAALVIDDEKEEEGKEEVAGKEAKEARTRESLDAVVSPLKEIG